MKKTASAIVILGLALTACTKNEEAAKEPSAATKTAAHEDTKSKTQTPVWDESAAPVAGASLAITPTEVDFCTDPKTKVDVAWDISSLEAKNPQIWVRGRKGDKLWVAFKDKTGMKTTGSWVRPYSEFLLVDSASKKLLVKVGVKAKACS